MIDPLPPKDFRVINYTNLKIVLSWKKPANGLYTGYELFRQNMSYLNISNPEMLKQNISDLEQFTRYNFSLRTVVGTENDRVNSKFLFASVETSKLSNIFF